MVGLSIAVIFKLPNTSCHWCKMFFFDVTFLMGLPFPCDLWAKDRGIWTAKAKDSHGSLQESLNWIWHYEFEHCLAKILDSWAGSFTVNMWLHSFLKVEQRCHVASNEELLSNSASKFNPMRTILFKRDNLMLFHIPLLSFPTTI